MNKQNLLLFFVFSSYLAFAQKNTFSIPDSLKSKNYDYLDNKIYDLRKDSTKAAVYLHTYICKAKKEHNWKELVNGYQNVLHQSPDNLRLTYADSMIYAAKNTADNSVIGAAFLSKGVVYYGRKEHSKAMDNYLVANSYISKTNDQYQIHKVKYHIALTKFYIGFYDESLSLLKECIHYYEENHPRPYLNSLHLLGMCYNKLGNYGLCTETNLLGFKECHRLEIPEMIPYFTHSQGINEYFLKNYAKSIQDIESSLDEIKENKDFANEAIGYFYLGKCFWMLNKKEKAVEYFQNVDKIFQSKKYLRADLRQSYELLINYYKQKKDINSQLYYVDMLLKADTLLVENNKYIVSKIHKQYDTKELMQEKDILQREKDNLTEEMVFEKNYDLVSAIIIFLMVLIITVLTYRHNRNKRLYEKRFEEYIADKNKNKSKIITEKLPIADINSETVSIILKQLEKFESDKKFLDKDWKQGTLAAYFNSNSNYLAGVIKHYREKSFADYINGLRIEYIVTMLQNERKFRNYTNSALAKEAGFSSTQRFANAFLAKMGMPAVFFIEQIKKEKL